MSEVTLPATRVDILDPRTGKVAADWYRFFQQTFVRIGGQSYSIRVVGDGLTYSAGTFSINSTPSSTPSTIVYRDASGNFSASTITAALDGNAATASRWALARTLSFSGDATGTGSVDGSGDVDTALTLVSTGVVAGSYADGTHVAAFSVDSKGRITSASNTAISFPVTSVFGQVGPVGNLSGDITTSGSTVTTLAATTVAAGSYGSATRATIFTVDAKGRLTAASDALITPAFSSLTGKPTTATGYGIASIDAVPIGGSTPAAGSFTTLSASSLVNLSSAGAGQIKFPAAQNASADANTLDDYEEGSWTPVPVSLTVVGTPTYVGKYTKIGNIVICHLRVTSTGTTTCTGGTTSFSGLPFAASVFGSASFANDSASSLGTGLVVGTSVSPPSWTTQSSATSTFVYFT